MALTVFIHSFVADSSPLGCCDLVGFFSFFSTLGLQVGHRLGFWGGLSCYVSFFWCQLFACLIRAAIFRCHRHLWSVLPFFATGISVQFLSFTAFPAAGIRDRRSVFALLAHIRVAFSCESVVHEARHIRHSPQLLEVTSETYVTDLARNSRIKQVDENRPDRHAFVFLRKHTYFHGCDILLDSKVMLCTRFS